MASSPEPRPKRPRKPKRETQRELATRLEHEVALERLVRSLGVDLEPEGDRLGGRCPLHPEDPEPHSLEIDPEANRWRCAACCPDGGTVLDWVMRTEGVSRRCAVQLLREDVVLTGKALRRRPGDHRTGVVKRATARALPNDFDATEDDALLEQVADFYHQTLLAEAGARAWLEEQGVRTGEVVSHFRLGLANRTLGLRLPKADRKSGAAVRRRMQELGVLRVSGHEHFAGCVVVPLHGPGGRVVQLCGHRLGASHRRSARARVWLREDRRGLFNPAAFEAEKVVVTATVLDALVLWSWGYRHVSATNGTDGPTEALQTALEHGAARKVVLLRPEGDIGSDWAERVATPCASRQTVVEHVTLHAPSCSDLVRAASDPETTLASLLGAPVVQMTPLSPEPDRDPSSSRELEPVPTPTTQPVVAPPTPTRDELVLEFEDRRWRIRGLAANKARGTLRANILVSRGSAGLHLDVFDVCTARPRAAFVRAAAHELAVDESTLRRDMGQVLLALEHAQDELLARAQLPAKKTPTMTDVQRDAAMALLRAPDLLDRVLADLKQLGVVGERDNLLLAYLAAVSRVLPQPLAVMVQSSSAAGKSSLVNAVLSLVPDEDRVVYSAMTGQSLYYMGSADLRHKVLCVAEDRGIDRAAYALKILQSEGRLTIASTGKDPGSGRLVSQEYTVEGPIAIMMTTTSIDLDDELLSRCLVLTVDESPEQTRQIHARQLRAQTLLGLEEHAGRDALLRLHHDAQRLLRPMRVLNPHTDALGSADLRVRARRDFRKLLGVVEVIAVLHQHQRERKTLEIGGEVIEAVEVHISDIELAKRLVGPLTPGPHELPQHTACILAQIDTFVVEQGHRLAIHRDHVRLSQRELRERFPLGRSQLAVHLRRLVDAELVRVHRAPQGRGEVYSLCFDGPATPTYVSQDPGVVRPGSGPDPVGFRPASGTSSSVKSDVVSETCAPKSVAEPALAENDTSGPNSAALEHVDAQNPRGQR